ncbi:MAG: hypothetical protein M3069_00725 [Chloroflexota bacterium]|nr:hypothetical protein [Chloroflexota bacterium]
MISVVLPIEVRAASPTRATPTVVVLSQAVPRYAERIDIFCQAGQIATPREDRAIVMYLQESVHLVVVPGFCT